MLTGKELGAAIEAARIKKGVTKKAMAEHFQVSPPSIQDWVNRGTIDKSRLPALWEYFSAVVEPEHWGLAPSSPAKPAAVKQSTRDSAKPPESAGLSAAAFSLGSRLDALNNAEHRRVAYAVVSNILTQYEELEAAATAPHPTTTPSPRAKRTAARPSNR